MILLVPNYSCLQNGSVGGYRPQIPFLSVLFPSLILLNPPTLNKFPGYATGERIRKTHSVHFVRAHPDAYIQPKHIIISHFNKHCMAR